MGGALESPYVPASLGGGGMRLVTWLTSLSLGLCGLTAEADVILTAGLDGRNLETVAEVPASIGGMALDAVNGRLYLAEQGTAADGRILRINIDGTDFQELVLGL